MNLVLASNNPKKLKELGDLLLPLGVNLLAQGALNIPEAPEPFHTFLENALTKARHAAHQAGKPAIADDSGICVLALNGEPGVLSARYAQQNGLPKNDEANNQLLLQKLQNQENRQARFVCTLVAVKHADDPEPLVATGRWEGLVAYEPAGQGGFGYDPLLYIPQMGKTVAQLSSEEKNRYSHRAQAMRQMIEQMRLYWGELA